MDAELEFAIQPSTTGKQLFDQVRSLNNMLNSALLHAFPWTVHSAITIWDFADACSVPQEERII